MNDKSYGGVFVSTNSGMRWEQISAGLDGRDVFALAESPEGTILAGTNHGIFALDDLDESTADTPAGLVDAPSAHWSPRNTIQNSLVRMAVEKHHGKRVNVEKRVKQTVQAIQGRVYALDLSGDAWLASTTGGLFSSTDHGAQLAGRSGDGFG